MKKSVIVAAMAASLVTATAVRAESHTIDLSLWSPSVQLHEPSDDVDAFRLAFYGENRDVTGLDLGIWTVTHGEFNGAQGALLYGRTEADFNGLQFGIISRVRGDMYGADLGWVNFVDGKACGFMDGLYNQVDGEMKGLQLGWVNNISRLNGVQGGFVNYADSINGLQIGLVNWANRGYGLQIGIINVFGDGFLPVFPIVNFNF